MDRCSFSCSFRKYPQKLEKIRITWPNNGNTLNPSQKVQQWANGSRLKPIKIEF
jgi:hypothetical protein